MLETRFGDALGEINIHRSLDGNMDMGSARLRGPEYLALGSE